MEVNAFDITVVNLCFGGAQRLKDRDCRPLCRLADRRTGNDLFDFSQAAAMRMLVWMPLLMLMCLTM